jgi:peroxiredoxin Q/BCP
MLKAGDKAPSFSLPSSDGSVVSLSDFKGKKVVLYFYLKDDTPGCTKEACEFRDDLSTIRRKGAVVVGISVDGMESHKKFSEKYFLPFPLLSDGGEKIVEAYGVWKEKNLYGRKYMGTERTTFLIDEEGRISHIFQKVKVDGHIKEVLEKL